MTENRLGRTLKRFLGSAVNALERLSEHSRPKSKEPASERVLLICVLHGKEFLERVLDAFRDIGISGATVLQSQGMGRTTANPHHCRHRDQPTDRTGRSSLRPDSLQRSYNLT